MSDGLVVTRRTAFGLRLFLAFIALSANICSGADASSRDSLRRRLTYSIWTGDKAIELATDEAREDTIAFPRASPGRRGEIYGTGGGFGDDPATQRVALSPCRRLLPAPNPIFAPVACLHFPANRGRCLSSTLP